ncbi:MAG: metallophosphoesterase, partial [Thermoleophilia bacterium]|nr:metallophosphoesterase [Thermoleophilia bacterium]
MTSPSSLRIAHVADLHIGSSYAHGDDDRGGVNSRLVDFRNAWVRSCHKMVAEAVDLVVFAGDAFRNCSPTPTEEAAFRAGLDVLADADIQVIATLGNHDIPKAVGRTDALEGFAGYRGCFTLVTRPQVIVHEVARLGGARIPVACFPYPMRSHLAAADPGFEKLTIDEQNAKIVALSLEVLRSLGAEAESLAGIFGCVLIAHGTIHGSQIGAQQSTAFLREPVLPISELRGLPFTAQCWGHLHRAQSFGDKRFEIGDHIRYS